MKTSFSLLSAAITASYPAITALAFAGVPLPAPLASATAFGLYVTAVVGLILVRDYSARPSLKQDSRRAAAECSAAASRAEAHRLAA